MPVNPLQITAPNPQLASFNEIERRRALAKQLAGTMPAENIRSTEQGIAHVIGKVGEAYQNYKAGKMEKDRTAALAQALGPKMQEMGLDPSVVSAFGGEEMARMYAQMAMQEAQARRQSEAEAERFQRDRTAGLQDYATKKQIDQKYTTPDAPTVRAIKQSDGSEVMVQWDGQTGSWVPMPAPSGGEQVLPRGAKMTESQSKDTVFATRAEGALGILDGENGMADVLAQPRGAFLGQVPGIGNYLKGKEYQQAEQAANEFLQALLRKDSGAVITVDEMQQYGGVYLPQPGDAPETLKQKAQSRKRALEAIKAGMPPQAILAQEEALRRSGDNAAPQGMPAAPAAPAQAAPQQGGAMPDFSTMSDEQLKAIINGR